MKRTLYVDPVERHCADDQLLESKPYLGLGVQQRVALRAAVNDGFLVGAVDSRCVFGAAPGARRLLHAEQEWAACAAVWLAHCRRTARSCVEVSTYPDGLAVVASRFGARTWKQEQVGRSHELTDLLRAVVSGGARGRWHIGKHWTTRAIPVADALKVASKCAELDQLMRAEGSWAEVMWS
jgi:hypothetical protein